MSTLAELWVCRVPGPVEYRAALALQERLRTARQAELIPDTMLLLEHPPVFTRGRRTGEGELMMPEDWYRSLGMEIVDVDRGGKITYHGPGQLVGYPIVRVGDVLEYVRRLERAVVRALAEEGVLARLRTAEGPDFTGVWVQERKIASIGVHVSRGITTHGFAVNVCNDLSPFDWVVACGLPSVQMTSLAAELGARGAGDASGGGGGGGGVGVVGVGGGVGCRAPGRLMPCFVKRTAYAVAVELGRRQRIISAGRLYAILDAAEEALGGVRAVTTASSVAESRVGSSVT